MLLAIDVGNTNTVLGLFEDVHGEGIRDHWRLASDQGRTADEWLLAIKGLLDLQELGTGDIDGIVIASVVPKITVALLRVFERVNAEPLVVGWQTDTGMSIAIDNPSELGPDRIANAVAVRAITDGPAIVIDMGTATTFDVVAADNTYLGGVILPGLEISLDALFDRAAALRRIDLSLPSPVIGAGTAAAVRSGASHGVAAQMDGLAALIEESLGRATVVATGGQAANIVGLSRRVDKYDPWLTLQGLRMIYERNRTNG